jgi:hypothetical protein
MRESHIVKNEHIDAMESVFAPNDVRSFYRPLLVCALEKLSEPMRALLRGTGVTVYPMEGAERFADVCSSWYKLGGNDSPYVVGAFVACELRAYVRDLTLGTLMHELAHGLDFSLGNGRNYRSEVNRHLVAEYQDASAQGLCVSTYAETNVAEYFAEGFVAYCNVQHSSQSSTVGRDGLRLLNPVLHSYFETLFACETVQALRTMQYTWTPDYAGILRAYDATERPPTFWKA